MVRPRRNWTAEEDAVLRSMVNNALEQSRPLLWRELAKSIPGRSNKDCCRRWWNSLADGRTKGSWAEEEDERLIEAVGKQGTNWSKVARDVRSRNSDQCSSHWSQVLDPNINFCDWTTEEDDCLLHAMLTHGTNWSTIAASHVPKRTTLALKNRFSTLRLRHENGNKLNVLTSKRTHQASMSNSKTRTVVPSEAVRTTRSAEEHPTNMPDEYGNGEDDEAEDEEDEEDDDVSEENEVEHKDTSENSSVPLTSDSNQAGVRAVGNLPKGSNMVKQSAWPRVSGPSDVFSSNSLHHETTTASADDWTKNIIDENRIPGNHPYLYSEQRDDFFGTIQDSIEPSVNGSYVSYGGNTMHLGFSPSTGYPDLSNTTLPLSSSPKLTETGTNPFQASCYMPATPIISSASSTSFQVSVSMVCTAPQLETALRGLAGAGMWVTMQIDPRP